MLQERRTVALLAGGQALLLTNSVVLISINGLVGLAMAPSPALATLPVTAYVVGGALATFPVSLMMQRIGRRNGFVIGALLGIAGSALCATAVFIDRFWVLCLGNFVLGGYNASAQYYRFAAADAAGPERRSRAISLVLGGGLVGGVLGPESSKLSRELLPTPFLGSYLTLIGFAVVALALVRTLALPPAPVSEQKDEGRPLLAIATQPIYLVAVLGATVGYAVMNLLMTATPLAMQMCHHGYSDTAFVIESHVVGMYAPSFVTGALIQRFGVLRIMFSGAALMMACVAVALSGIDLMHFWAALVLLGVGWNFLYIGGTTLLTESYVPAERARAQGLNEVFVFSSMALSSALSGLLVTRSGWETLNYFSVPFLVGTVGALAWLGMRHASRAPA